MPHLIPADGVLSDCDGVLVDSLESAACAWDEWALTWAPSYDFRTQVEHGVRAADTVAALVDSERLDAAISALDELELKSASATAAIRGAVALTLSLPASSWAVVTSATRALALARLSSAGHTLPAYLVSAENVTMGKPSPEPYLAGAMRLGLKPARCVVLEDAPAGVRAARAAGVGWVIGVGDHLADADVDFRVEHLGFVTYADGALLIMT